MAGTVQRLIRHVWGFLNAPAYIENKQQSYNEGDDGAGSDRTQLVAKGPTGILHTFRTWDETTSYISNQISTFGSNIYVEIRTVEEFISAMQLSEVVSLMIMNEIVITSDVGLSIYVISNKNIFSLNDNYLRVGDSSNLFINTNSQENPSGNILVDFYCPVSCNTTCSLYLTGGNVDYVDTIRFTQVNNVKLYTYSVNSKSSILYEDSNSSFEQEATHEFWSNKSIHGRLNSLVSENFVSLNRFGNNCSAYTDDIYSDANNDTDALFFGGGSIGSNINQNLQNISYITQNCTLLSSYPDFIIKVNSQAVTGAPIPWSIMIFNGSFKFYQGNVQLEGIELTLSEPSVEIDINGVLVVGNPNPATWDYNLEVIQIGDTGSIYGTDQATSAVSGGKVAIMNKVSIDPSGVYQELGSDPLQHKGNILEMEDGKFTFLETNSSNGEIFSNANMILSNQGQLSIPFMTISGTGNPVYINEYGRLWENTSSERFKENIVKSDLNTSDVLLFEIMKFNRIGESVIEYGPIAERVVEINPLFATYDRDGITPKGVHQNNITYAMLEEIKKLRVDVDILKNQIKTT